MNTTNLYYFVVTAEEMNLSRAAKRLFITEQSLSKQISRLEEEQGAEFFLRSRGRQIAITEAGRCFYENAREILAIERKNAKQLKDMKEFSTNELVICIPRVRAYYSLPPILEKYCQLYPDVHIRIISGSSAHVAESMLNGTADVGIGLDIEGKEFSCVPLTKEKQYIVLHRKLFQSCFTPEEQESVLAGKSAPLSAFMNCPFVICDTNIWAGKYFQDLVDEAHFTPNVRIKSDDFMVVYRMCKIGLGASIIAGSLLQHLKDDSGRSRSTDLIYVALEDQVEEEQAQMMLVTRKNDYLSIPCRNFIDLVMQHYRRRQTVT